MKRVALSERKKIKITLFSLECIHRRSKRKANNIGKVHKTKEKILHWEGKLKCNKIQLHKEKIKLETKHKEHKLEFSSNA